MNLALFVTKSNMASLAGLVQQAAELQRETVNGALIVAHDHTLKPADIAFTLDLAARFKASASLPVQVNASHSEPEQIASMFSGFLTSAYTRYPGPWLLFDEPALPKEENWMQAALRQHGAFGGKMTGRAITNPGSARPIGPVTMELDFKALKFLRFPTRQSWRERGQFLFARHGFQLVPADQWLFRMERAETAEMALEVEPTQGETAAIADTTPPAPIESTQPESARPRINPEYIANEDAIPDEDLRKLIETASGKKPHHFTGREKLLAMARELQSAPA